MAVTISVNEVQVYAAGASDALVADLIQGTLARAATFAPCILRPDFSGVKAAAARDILIAVIVRAIEAGSGAVTTITAGPHSKTVDTNKPRRARFTADEQAELRALCGLTPGGAFTIQTADEIPRSPRQLWEDFQ